MHTRNSLGLHDALIAIVRAQIPETPADPLEQSDEFDEFEEPQDEEAPEPDDYVSPSDCDRVQARWEAGR